jgi:hypothetical protein
VSLLENDDVDLRFLAGGLDFCLGEVFFLLFPLDDDDMTLQEKLH